MSLSGTLEADGFLVSLTELNPWGFTSVAATIVSLSFAWFLWKFATPMPTTRRFIVLLLVEIVTAVTSSSGLPLLFNYGLSRQTGLILDIIHHIGDFLMLVLYPIFVAYAVPVRFLKPLTATKGRYTLYAVGLISFIAFMLIHFPIFRENYSYDPMATAAIDMYLYLAMVVMFVVIFFVSLAGVRAAKTKLAREKAIAFACAFGFRDLCWAAVYLLAATGWYQHVPVLTGQLYVGSTLLYIPIMVYGILKLQMLDIEIRLKSTIRNSILAGMFAGIFYLVFEGANTLVSDQFSGLIGFAVSALLTWLLTPLHQWAERVSSKLVSGDIEDTDYASSRSLQVYSAAVEETLAYGDITKGHVALLDRLRDSLQVSAEDAARLEKELRFDRAAISG
ncbi:MAG: hypothetical protein R3200_03880 [Xanthomonadales bacterium]|nr:hypothetical protein [Xanthomonadales bacterium]